MWAAVARATVNGQLGVTAKVATEAESEKASASASETGRARLTYVYTCDSKHKQDVRRVPVKLRET